MENIIHKDNTICELRIILLYFEESPILRAAKTTSGNVFPTLLLSLLGFASRLRQEPVMYGYRAPTPAPRQVTDKSGNPIPEFRSEATARPKQGGAHYGRRQLRHMDDRHPERHMAHLLRTRTVRKTAASSPKRASR